MTGLRPPAGGMPRRAAAGDPQRQDLAGGRGARTLAGPGLAGPRAWARLRVERLRDRPADPRRGAPQGCFLLSFCAPRGVMMTCMKTRPESRRRVDDAQARLPHELSPSDTNLAFLRALADALRDILRDEQTHIS